MLTLNEAYTLLHPACRPLPPVVIATIDAAGMRLASDVAAETDWPAADVSMMDGYAARAADLVARAPLKIAFEVAAGKVGSELPAGCCARIFTGAMLPPGADVVVPQEQAEVMGEAVRLTPLPAGEYVRKRGEVCAADAALAQSGAQVTPQLLGALVAAGPVHVRATPRPRVGILTTGAELLAADAPLEAGKIRDSNGPMLAALARDARFEVSQSLRADDSPEAITGALGRLLADSDLILTNGGVSVGDYDFLPEALRRLGGEILFHKLAIKPGKPTLVARLGEAWLVGLPGNPASAFVAWHVIARPIAERLAGLSRTFGLQTTPARLGDKVENRGGRMMLGPALLALKDDERVVTPMRWKGSHDIAALARANALVVVAGDTTLERNAIVQCVALNDAWE